VALKAAAMIIQILFWVFNPLQYPVHPACGQRIVASVRRWKGASGGQPHRAIRFALDGDNVCLLLNA
jgi:hypothetical protein